ncbi:type II secretion system F family protein [Verticiella sediminum]|uniref:Type II secretion system F family protein n=1 Tax=Verticiella sediminum TaxID=1247510 RepID=A0A556AQ22_9BURK|nr:type II secretion system F family protein [Verticiella sediminum]TSH94999.1 type II secretion system F family protein [Verticiella sediminum]
MWGIVLLCGVAAAALAGLAAVTWRAWPTPPRMAASVALPWWWRWLRPLAWAAAPALALWPSAGARRVAAQRCRDGGLPADFLPAEVVSMARLCGALGACAGAAAAWRFDAALAGGLLCAVLGASAGLLPRLWLREQAQRRRDAIARALPFMLDMTTLCVEGGLNVQGALHVAVEKGPAGPLRDEIAHLLGDIRAGASRLEACRQMAQRIDVPGVRAWVGAMIQAETVGTSLGPLLRVQAEQRRAERFLRAEKRALQAPVKMLFPLIVFIFPCTFIVIAFPIVVKLLAVFGG